MSLQQKLRRYRKKPPVGWDELEPKLEEFDTKMREAEAEPHEGKRKTEALWPIFRIHHQRSRYIFDLFWKEEKISRELYQFCLDAKIVDSQLMAKWKKPGYENLCCLPCVQSRDTNFGTNCICRVPKSKLEADRMDLEGIVEDATIESTGRSLSVFVLDCASEMFEMCDDKTYVEKALIKIRDHLNAIALSAQISDYVSVVFMNTPFCQAADNQIIVYSPMENVSADLVLQINELLDGDFVENFTKEYGKDFGNSDIKEVFYKCRKLFGDHQKCEKRVYIYSRNYEALKEEEGMNLLSKHMKNNEEHMSIVVTLIGFPLGKRPSRYWQIIDPGYEYRLCDIDPTVLNLDGIRRANCRVPFNLGPGLEIAVGVFNLIREKKKPNAINLDAATNEPAERGRQFVRRTEDTEMAEEVLEGENEPKMFKTEIGGRELVLSSTEMQSLSRLESPGIHLIGFKKMSCLKPSHRMGASHFIYPLEEMITGSKNLYTALLQKCAQKEVFALVRVTFRVGSTPKVCALIPQLIDSENKPHVYEGFHCIELPVYQSKRSMEIPYQSTTRRLGEMQVEPRSAIKSLVEKLTANYQPDLYLNPVIQSHYAMVECLALKYDQDECLEKAKLKSVCIPYYEDPEWHAIVRDELAELANELHLSDQDKKTMGRNKRQGEIYAKGTRNDTKRPRKK
ncbi:Protein BUD31-like protein [Aphelenchoides besseyi]|nr:Protein BUD31-like protein [Aphelenchoides besseyi]